MLNSVSEKTLQTLRFVRDNPGCTPAQLARHKAGNGATKGNEDSARAYMRKLIVAGLLLSPNASDGLPNFSITLDGRFVIWMCDIAGYTRADGKWWKNKAKLDQVELIDLMEEFRNDNA